MKKLLRYSFVALLAMFGLINAQAADVIYESAVLEDWTADNKVLPEELTYVWKADASKGYMKGSAYYKQDYAAESWLISPEIDLTNAAEATLSFEHAGNYYTSQAKFKEEATLWIKAEGGEWTQVEIKYYSQGSSWSFEINEIDIKAYVGKKIQVAFKYLSTAEKAGTWEIKNFSIKAGKDDPNAKGGELNPYSVEEIQALTEDNLPSGKVWVEGYIAGCVNTSNGSELATGDYVATNLGLSQTGKVTTVIPIQLPSGNVRTALNLQDNPSNLGKGIVVFGEIKKYCGVIGVKSVSNYVFNEKSVTIEIVTPEEEQRTSWDFTKWSAATVAALKADAAASKTAGWSDVEKAADAEAGKEPTEASKDNCFWSVAEPNADGTISANGVVIEELKGLKWNKDYSIKRSLAIAVNYPETSLGTYAGPAYLWLGGGKNKIPCFTIPGVKGGSAIIMEVESHKPAEGRGVELYTGVDAEGLVDAATKIGDTFTPTTKESHAWIIENDCDVIVYNTNGCHIYKIAIEDASASIVSLKADDKVAEGIFNLAGQRLAKAQKGLNIINGKKVMVK